MIAGASGLVGQEIQRLLLADPRIVHITSLVRRPAAETQTKLEARVVDFAQLPELAPHDLCFIALGTTMRKAGSKEAFRAVDLEAVVNVARASRKAGAKRVGLVSALGASSTSSVFYNKVKGEAEAQVRALGFDLCVIARPSILDGERTESRPGERIGLGFARVLAPLIPKRYRAVPAASVARTLVESTVGAGSGVQVLESEVLHGGTAAPIR